VAQAAAETLRRTPLHDRHQAAGARLVPFAGWEMPVQYEGIRQEHVAVRTEAGVFDVSHMGEIETSGPGAGDFLQRVLSNDVSKIEPGSRASVGGLKPYEIITHVNDRPIANVKAFVTQFNKLDEKLKSLTFFDGESGAKGLLFGSSEALRIETTYTKLLSGTTFGAGDIRTIGELGLSIGSDGELKFNESRFADKLSENSESVQTFLTQEQSGFIARLNDASDRLAGVNNSLLISRSEALGQRILRNSQQADMMQIRLDAERQRLLKQFISAEEAIAKLQANQNAISQIQLIRMPSRDR
jgi:hypothetical protein